MIHGPFGLIIWVQVDTSQVDETIDAVQKALSDLRPLWRFTANVMRRSFAENFRQGGRPRWEPLKIDSVAGKARNPYAVYASMHGRTRVRRLEQARSEGGPMRRSLQNMLVVSGALRDSAATKDGNHVERVSMDGLEIGSKHFLAAIHQYGTGLRGPKGRRYIIRPVRAKSLRWFGPNGPKFAQEIHHPGVPPRPFIMIQPEDMKAVLEAAARYASGDADAVR